MPGLRERQTELARTAILDAAADCLRAERPDEVSLADVARSAGVSLRTLYRYFPTRDDLFSEAGHRLLADLGLSPEVSGGDVATSYLSASAALAKEPVLARNLLRTTIGRQVRAPGRQQRQASIAHAVASAGRGLTPTATTAGAAVIGYLCSAASWVTICDETGLDADAARHAVAWAISTLLSAVATGDGPAAPPTSKETR